MDIKYIPLINATDMPTEVEEYCVKHDINTHYQNDITFVENNGNPFAEWLKNSGYVFKGKDGDFVGILST